MGTCFSKKTSTTALTPAPLNSDLKSNHQPPQNTTNDQQGFKKQIFVIKQRVSHELDRHSDQQTDKNLISSCSKDAILLQCDRLSRSNSAGAQNPIRRRRYSRSKRSFDLGLNTFANANSSCEDDVNASDADADADDDDSLNHRHHRHRQNEIRVSSSGRYSSKERRISISPNRRTSSSKERRISISPSRRSDSPFSNENPHPHVTANRPAKMVSVPATHKSNNNAGVVGPVKRIHVKRNVSPARTSIRVFTDDCTREVDPDLDPNPDSRRKSLVEIDNNAVRRAQTRDTKRTRKLSRDLDVNLETAFDPSPSPPSYASLLLEDIHNFHQKNTANASSAQPTFALPECVSKACLIMEAVADMNSNTSSLCSDDRWRNIKKDTSGMT